MDAMSEDKSEYSDAEDNMDNITESEIPANDQQYDEQLDMAAEQAEFEKIKAAKEDLLFPDEIDTPQDVPAKVRFQKYRGLESFRCVFSIYIQNMQLHSYFILFVELRHGILWKICQAITLGYINSKTLIELKSEFYQN